MSGIPHYASLEATNYIIQLEKYKEFYNQIKEIYTDECNNFIEQPDCCFGCSKCLEVWNILDKYNINHEN